MNRQQGDAHGGAQCLLKGLLRSSCCVCLSVCLQWELK